MNKYLLNLFDKFYSIDHYNMGLYTENNELIRLYTATQVLSKIYPHFLDYEKGQDLIRKEGYLGIYSLIVDQKTKNKLIIGPFINKEINPQTLNTIKYKYSLDENDMEDIKKEVASSSYANYISFLNVTSFFNYLINKKDVNVMDIFTHVSKNIKVTMEMKKANTFIQESFASHSHDTYEIEQLISKYIEKGDVENLETFFKYISKNANLSEGKLADNELRQQKNLFIGLIAVIGKGPLIRGGVSIEEAYNLIDFYTQECEKLNTIEAINNLRYTALTNLVKLVRNNKSEGTYSADVLQAVDYIKANITTNIGIEDVLSKIRRKRTSFLNQFKSETNFTLGKYIQKVKLEEAKNLLEFTNTSILDISLIFNFSSQSYFHNVFKKEYGITPLEFRKKKRQLLD